MRIRWSDLDLTVSPWLDATLVIDEHMPVYPGDVPLSAELLLDTEHGDAVNLKRYRITGHVGTHVDAPRHLFPGGPSVADLDPALFVGPARVVQIDVEGAIDVDALESAMTTPAERVLLKTRASEAWAARQYRRFPVPFLTPAAANWLLQRRLRLLGLDSLSMDPVGSAELPAHRILLGAGVPLIEGLNLVRIDPGEYWLLAMPLPFKGGDGSPVRALLRPIRDANPW